MAGHIYAYPPHVGSHGRQVNVKFVNGPKEVSLALDDSCGALKLLSRGDLRCYAGEADITEQVFPEAWNGQVYATPEQLQKALAWLAEPLPLFEDDDDA